MAIEYVLEATPVLDAAAMLDYFADLIGCDERFDEPGDVPRAVRREVQLTTLETPSEDDPEEEPLLGELFGVDQTVTLTFRMNKFLTREEDGAIFRDMLAACAKFLEDHPGAKGIFSYQYDHIYLQRLDEDGIVLSERLRDPDFNTDGVLDELLATYPSRELGMVDAFVSDD
ncbi:hypothetical protein LO763_14395 [Glycomyces sp. A-F 0318]|uniref:SitI3 family protein n=1 Tax=Glycomyces amatae TaxID=2881355 RepID=UPI001E566095|nr:SitI3 family protein [Glycomyces amatae]MCD0444805.1 hypothetical protein [Glycomyces amatae]